VYDFPNKLLGHEALHARDGIAGQLDYRGSNVRSVYAGRREAACSEVRVVLAQNRHREPLGIAIRVVDYCRVL
jgi:hypothetical protein